MYGKHFESMYEGSMYGAGVSVFAVWGYIISHARNGYIELNPRKLADTLGGTQDQILEALEFLQAPDPNSRWKEEEGRRLVKEGEFQYRMPSWDKYQSIKSDQDRREYNRIKQAEHRARMQKNRAGGSGGGGAGAAGNGIEKSLADLNDQTETGLIHGDLGGEGF